MKTKNHVKSPKEDSLRGIGKLGWTEGGKMHSIIKSLSSTFENDKIHHTTKEKVTCSVCGAKLKTNNSDRVPNHVVRPRYWFSGRFQGNNICKGSYGKQYSGESYKQLVGSTITYTYGEKFRSGDHVYIDFTRAILKPYYNVDEIVLTEIEEIYTVYNLANDGSVFSKNELIKFKNITKPIPVYSLGKHIILA